VSHVACDDDEGIDHLGRIGLKLLDSEGDIFVAVQLAV
jgi:hypothetical protein